MALLVADEVREFLSDYPETNLLLDDKEFSNTFIELCMSLAISEFNSISPATSYQLDLFPSKSVLLYGTCWQMFLGRSALMARNHLNYTDGGLQIPVEEKFELYQTLAGNFQSLFASTAQKLKINLNMNDGWSQVSSEQAFFPLW